jgi:arabinan endo-1,5-alpha-L-arabinosidase
MPRFAFRLLAIASVAFALHAQAALSHRYNFNDGTANDSVGGANGTLMNGATVAGGQLYFDPAVNNGQGSPSTGQYVNLPSNILDTKNFTLETWFTDRSSTPWQRILDLGNPEGGGFLILCPFNRVPGEPLGQLSIFDHGGPTDTNFVAGGGALKLNTAYMLAYVHDLADGHEYLYLNGNLVGTSKANQDPTTTAYHDFYIGRSNFAADPYLDGTVDELRTWDNALTGADIAADYAAGPDAVAAAVPLPRAAGPAVVTLALAAAAGLLARRHRSLSPVAV